jgi:hypothetical protein
LFFGQSYYWRVRARNNIDTSVWTVKNFETIDYVQLSTPADGSLNVSISGITLDWNAHPTVNSYHFQFDTVSTFNSTFLIDQNIAYINSSNVNADTKYLTGALIANKLYYWKVRAINAVDTSTWTIRYFSTGNCQEPGFISGTTEICEASENVYSITPVTGATSYNWVLPSGWIGNSTTNSISATSSSNSGTIKVSANNSCGVSSERILYVDVNPLPNTPFITQTGNILHSDALNGNQWYNQNGILTGETNQDLTVTSNGDYYCIVTLNGCSSDTSNTVNVILTGIELSGNDNNINLYPNPVSNELFVEIEGNNEIKSIVLINSLGQVLYKEDFINRITISTANYSSGVYLVKIGNDKSYKLRKIIKK